MFKSLTALSALVMLATPAFARPADDRLTIRIPVSAQDMATPQNRVQLAGRVDRAIRTACRREWSGAVGVHAIRGDVACRKTMHGDADAKLLAFTNRNAATLLASAS